MLDSGGVGSRGQDVLGVGGVRILMVRILGLGSGMAALEWGGRTWVERLGGNARGERRLGIGVGGLEGRI